MFGTTVRPLYKSYIFWVVPYGGYWHQCAAVLEMMNNHFIALYAAAPLWLYQALILKWIILCSGQWGNELSFFTPPNQYARHFFLLFILLSSDYHFPIHFLAAPFYSTHIIPLLSFPFFCLLFHSFLSLFYPAVYPPVLVYYFLHCLRQP